MCACVRACVCVCVGGGGCMHLAHSYESSSILNPQHLVMKSIDYNYDQTGQKQIALMTWIIDACCH